MKSTEEHGEYSTPQFKRKQQVPKEITTKKVSRWIGLVKSSWHLESFVLSKRLKKLMGSDSTRKREADNYSVFLD